MITFASPLAYTEMTNHRGGVPMTRRTNLVDGPTAPDPPVAAHRTVVFTDIVGSTALLNEVGDLRWLRVIVAHHQHAQRLGRQLGAEHVGGTGDGVFGVFSDGCKALRFAADMHRQMRLSALDGHCTPVHLRVGVATGPVLNWQDDYFGRTLHLAARLCSAAGADGVIVSAGCAKELPDPERYLHPRYALELRGFDGVEAVHKLKLDRIESVQPTSTLARA